MAAKKPEAVISVETGGTEVAQEGVANPSIRDTAVIELLELVRGNVEAFRAESSGSSAKLHGEVGSLRGDFSRVSSGLDGVRSDLTMLREQAESADKTTQEQLKDMTGTLGVLAARGGLDEAAERYGYVKADGLTGGYKEWGSRPVTRNNVMVGVAGAVGIGIAYETAAKFLNWRSFIWGPRAPKIDGATAPALPAKK